MVEPLTPRLCIKGIVRLYIISDDGRQADLRRAEKLEDDVKVGVASFRGGCDESY